MYRCVDELMVGPLSCSWNFRFCSFTACVSMDRCASLLLCICVDTSISRLIFLLLYRCIDFRAESWFVGSIFLVANGWGLSCWGTSFVLLRLLLCLWELWVDMSLSWCVYVSMCWLVCVLLSFIGIVSLLCLDSRLEQVLAVCILKLSLGLNPWVCFGC